MKIHAESARGGVRVTVPAWLHVATCTALFVATCILGTAAAQLDVQTAGGPLTLPEEVGAALAAWRDEFPDGLTEPTASVAFAPELLGPETASLTLRWDDGRTEVLLAPERYRAGPVLVHEIGVLLGLPEIGPGVMDPLLTADSADGPTAEDISRLRDLFTYPPADLTRDGTVDFYDLAAFSAAYGSVGINLRADLTGDGRVDDADLNVLREAYTFATPSASSPSPTNLAPDGAPTAPTPGIGEEPISDDAGADEPSGETDPSDVERQDPVPPPSEDGSGGDAEDSGTDAGDSDTGDSGAGEADDADSP